MATDALVSFVVEELCSIAKDRLSSLFEVKNEVEELKSTFLDIQAVLEDAESHRVMDERVQGWLWELKEVAYEVEDILDEWVTDALVLQEDKDETHHPKKMRFSFPSLLQSCKQVTLQYDIGKRIREITKRLSEISIKKNRFNLRVLNTREVRLAPNKEERETGSLIDESVIFGRDDIKQSIIEQLLSEEKSVSIVSIVGMGGLGKTTLAQLIYNDGRVTAHFGKNRIWVCVSDPFDVKSIAIKVIESMDGSTSNNPDLDTLQRNLREAIDKKRFLLVLDDVWDETGTQWEKLRVPLMGAAPGSKILVTTRSGEVGKAMKTHHSHDLGVLSDPDCWKLFKSIAFEGAEDKDGQELIATGERILKRCKGVPLAVKSVGSLLRRRREKWYWDHILKSEIWEWEIDGILPALFLSYYDLPPYLKRCFSFCSVFPKDYPMEKIELVQLWMAHGLIKSKKAKEDVTEEIGGMYYDSLLTRSLFQDAQKDIDGNVFVCKMHDLVHDLATYVSSHDYCSREAGDPELSSIKCHHLSLLVSDATSFIQSPLCSAERLRTLLLYGSATCKEVPERFFTPLKFLRALGLRRTKIENLLSSLGKLKHLRFLDLSELNIIELPEFVSDFCNLQTLNLNRCKRLSLLPSGISKMVKLRHLEINKTYDLTVLPNGIGKLTSLRALCKFPVGDENGGCKIGELKELNLLKGNFEIKNLERVINVNDAREAELHKKSDLHGLSLCCNNKSDEEWRTLEDDEMERMDSVLEGLRPPHSNLKGLKIINYAGSKFPSWLEDSKFSSLVRVVLVNCRKCMLLPEGLGQLKALQTLHIENCEILSSLPEGLGQLKALQTLKIWGCKRLSSLFDGFEQLKSLSRLDIWDCPQLRPLPNLQHLTALERLSIQKCPLLTERLEKEKGEDWCKISHIPRISIDEEDYAYDEYLLRWMFPQMDIAETKVYFPEMDIEEMKMYYLQLQASGISSLITRCSVPFSHQSDFFPSFCIGHLKMDKLNMCDLNL